MAAEIHDGGEKKLKVMFKKVGYIEKDYGPYEHHEKKAQFRSQCKKIPVMNKRMESGVDVICTENRIIKIAKAVRKTIKRENMVTDKFIEDVESMVKCFKPELDKMQELFDSILKKLPEIQLEISATTC